MKYFIENEELLTSEKKDVGYKKERHTIDNIINMYDSMRKTVNKMIGKDIPESEWEKITINETDHTYMKVEYSWRR